MAPFAARRRRQAARPWWRSRPCYAIEKAGCQGALMASDRGAGPSSTPQAWANGSNNSERPAHRSTPRPRRQDAAGSGQRSVEAAGRTHALLERPGAVRPAWPGVVDETAPLRRAPGATACLDRDFQPHLLTMTGHPDSAHPGPLRAWRSGGESDRRTAPRSARRCVPKAAAGKSTAAGLPADSPAGGPGLRSLCGLAPGGRNRKHLDCGSAVEVHMDQLSGEGPRDLRVRPCCRAAWKPRQAGARSPPRWRRHRLLVSTHGLVEVGVDVPEASVMVMSMPHRFRPAPAAQLRRPGGPGGAAVSHLPC